MVLGVLATTFREYAASQTLDRKWIIFDGKKSNSFEMICNCFVFLEKVLSMLSGLKT